MRILVVGGTGFLGKAIAVAARDKGHEVSVLSRGSAPAPAGTTPIIADRMALPDLHAFDAVLDTCAYRPDMVQALKTAIGAAHYTLISSISVYDALPEPGMDETTSARPATDAELSKAAEVAPENSGNAMAYGAAYGPLKRSCEDAAGDAAIIRLGLIVGAGDKTDRFTWWVRRIDQGDCLALPKPADRSVQVIDVRDAAAFALSLAVSGTSGTFNVTGPARPLDQIISTVQGVCASDVEVDWHPLQRFTDAGMRPWLELPLILPDETDKTHMLDVSIASARTAGLTTRPLVETVRDVLDWDRERRNVPLTAGMTLADEAKVTGD